MDRVVRVRKICLPIFLFLSTIPFSGPLNAQVQERKFELQASSPEFWNLLDRDANTASFRRVPYEIQQTQEEIRERGLPDALAERLAHGV